MWLKTSSVMTFEPEKSPMVLPFGVSLCYLPPGPSDALYYSTAGELISHVFFR